jgi:hypothetical protein
MLQARDWKEDGPMSATKKPWLQLAVSGVLSAACYAALFSHEAEVMASFTRTDGLYWLLSVAVAFVFSFVHGAFTGYFWEAVGIRPRPQARRPPAGIDD